jgi:hypothetical protein
MSEIWMMREEMRSILPEMRGAVEEIKISYITNCTLQLGW